MSSQAIASASAVFKAGKALGCDMDLLDIGGGFAGCVLGADGTGDLGRVPAAVNAALDTHFPPLANVRIIAEPGRCVLFAMLVTSLPSCLLPCHLPCDARAGPAEPISTHVTS